MTQTTKYCLGNHKKEPRVPSVSYLSDLALEGVKEIDTYLSGREVNFLSVGKLNDLLSNHRLLDTFKPRFPYPIISTLVNKHYSESAKDKEMETISTELENILNPAGRFDSDTTRLRKLTYYLTDFSRALYRRVTGLDSVY